MAHSTSQTPFLTVTKSFTYRGLREQWSNVYHLDSEPPSSNDWIALFNAVWALEGAFLPADVEIEAGTGHTPGTPPTLVWETDAPPAGPGGAPGQYVPAANEYAAPGDSAMWCRWTTDLKSKLGKPIYLRNYYHAVHWAGNADVVSDTQHTRLQTLALTWQQGITANGRTYRRTGPNHGTPQDHAAGAYITTRTLKRRGKRKKIQPPAASSSGIPDWAKGAIATAILDALLVA